MNKDIEFQKELKLKREELKSHCLKIVNNPCLTIIKEKYKLILNSIERVEKLESIISWLTDGNNEYIEEQYDNELLEWQEENEN